MECLTAPVDVVDVNLSLESWGFAVEHHEAIVDFWDKEITQNPHLYDGCVHIMKRWSIEENQSGLKIFKGIVIGVQFSEFLFWKKFGHGLNWGFDFSGGAAIFTADRHLLMVVSGPNSVVPGVIEFPSGFVDKDDIRDDGSLDFKHHVERELFEELPLTKDQIAGPDSLFVSIFRDVVQILCTYRSDMKSSEVIECESEGVKTGEIGRILALKTLDELDAFQCSTTVKAAVNVLLGDSADFISKTI